MKVVLRAVLAAAFCYLPIAKLANAEIKKNMGAELPGPGHLINPFRNY